MALEEVVMVALQQHLDILSMVVAVAVVEILTYQITTQAILDHL
tara:strand:+ start:50 stop:181 length:132 start_codon:yes stop_codon:yes gene_type:complete